MSEQENSVAYPSILFRAGGGLYCANSRYVSTIMELPKYQLLPDTPAYITGIFPYRNRSVTMFDLRAALSQPTLAEEYESFSHMLDDRKQDHVNWVNALERSIQTGEAFTLTKDPHKCALGRWYDDFKSDSIELSLHMAKLDDPHKRLHHAAERAEECDKSFNGEEKKAGLQEILREVRQDYVPQVLSVLEEAKEIFRLRAYHEMVLVLSGNTQLGIVVDEVLAVEELNGEPSGSDLQQFCHSPYIQRIVKSDGYPELILELDVNHIIDAGQIDCLKSPAKTTIN